ncbi:nonribosomal peptide synthetase gloA [Colletotrichum liriopes]|uniref:Nonribosomal peptide synthetase gloA n=1 Tax=Colletotrichum liriopes TaxID=708192 RepID=A0AA37GYX2_9PEZI|nr:nonribosomal peptide synthetase gloA [Colletotrichum liriopes]
MRDIWVKVLRLPMDAIGRDNSFLRIGRDSIRAIRLVNLARGAGLGLTVKNIFDDPWLSSMSATAVELDMDAAAEEEDAKRGQNKDGMAPFSLLGQHIHNMAQTLTSNSNLRRLSGISETDVVKDAYPCTQLQEGLLAARERQPGSFVLKTVYRLQKQIDLDRFKAAWELVVSVCASLRTRAAIVKGEAIQLAFKNDVVWKTDCKTEADLQSVLRTISKSRITYGSHLCQYALAQAEGSHYFVLFMHHSISNGWTIRLIMETLHEAYDNINIQPLRSFARFVNYARNLNEEAEIRYWKSQLQNAERAAFPSSALAPSTARSVTKSLNSAIDF